MFKKTSYLDRTAFEYILFANSEIWLYRFLVPYITSVILHKADTIYTTFFFNENNRAIGPPHWKKVLTINNNKATFHFLITNS